MKNVNTWIQQIAEASVESRLSLIEKAFWYKSLRPIALRQLQKYIIASSKAFNDPRRPARVIQDKVEIMQALFSTGVRALERKQLPRPMIRSALRALMGGNVLCDDARQQALQTFAENHNGRRPPGTLVISPSKACNLRCSGCYASADQKSAEHLEWDLFDRIITEAKTLWGIRFFTISGGEPFAYRSQGKGLLDAVAKHPDCFFLSYTNGTLIDEATAARIAELGNLIPAISVEGMEAATDKRRSPGVFQRVLDAMANLRRAHTPFGISLTATRLNAEELLSDEVIDFFFEEQQATFGWVFQYMPIGRGYTLDLLPTPEQRVWMWRRVWEIIREREIFLADFWNCGTVTEGCIAAAVYGGYLYIDWNANVMPCVFVPYSPANIREVYASGKTLDDVYDLPYFQGIRNWQLEYGLGREKPEETGNWLLPCSFRDNYGMARDLISRYQPRPEDEAAAEALQDEPYRKGMLAYDEALRKVFDPIWEREYLQGQPCAVAGVTPGTFVPEQLVQISNAPREPAAD